MSDELNEYHDLKTRVLAALRDDLREEEFDALALEIHAFQRRWNQPFANFCATRSAPKTWREIPAVSQSAFKRYALSVAPESVAKTFRTSGTTGEGFGEHHFIDTQIYERAIMRGWARLQRPALPRLFLTPAPQDAPLSSLAHMMGVLADGAEHCFAIDAGGRFDATRITAFLSRCEPLAMLGTALAFLNLFEQFPSLAPLVAGSFALETGGYKGSGRAVPKAELYEMFHTRLVLAPDDIFNEYGMTELSSQFYTRGLGRAHEGGPWVRALVIDPETGGEVEPGGTGALRIFDLANLGSVLAVETRDLAIRREHGFELIGRDPGALPRGCSRVADEGLQR